MMLGRYVSHAPLFHLPDTPTELVALSIFVGGTLSVPEAYSGSRPSSNRQRLQVASAEATAPLHPASAPLTHTSGRAAAWIVFSEQHQRGCHVGCEGGEHWEFRVLAVIAAVAAAAAPVDEDALLLFWAAASGIRQARCVCAALRRRDEQ